MIKTILPALFIAFLFAYCSDKLEDPDNVPLNEQLTITVSRDTLLADASDTSRVFARVPLPAGRIDITFTTTRGIFMEADAKSIKQLTDSISGEYRYATVILKSDSTKGTCYLTAESGTIRKRYLVTFR